MKDIELVSKYVLQTRARKERPTAEIRRKRRNPADAGINRHDRDARTLISSHRRRAVRERSESLCRMDDGNRMTSLGERMGKTLHLDAVAPEVGRRVEGRQEAEPQRPTIYAIRRLG